MTDPWGRDEPPAVTGPVPPLPPRLARLAEVQASGVPLTGLKPYTGGFPRAKELPEVQVLMRAGWQPLHEAPLYYLLPAAWPAKHRTWVPDRLPRVSMGGTTDEYYGGVAPLADDGWLQDDVAEEARAAGLPDPPSGRLWLLRSPWPAIPVTVILKIVWAIVEPERTRDATRRVHEVARDVLTWDEARALAACPHETRELLDA